MSPLWASVFFLVLASTMACASGAGSSPRQECFSPEATEAIFRQLASKGISKLTPEDLAASSWPAASDGWPPIETDSEEQDCEGSRTFLSNQRIIGNRGECLVEITFENLREGKEPSSCNARFSRLYILSSADSKQAAVNAVEHWIAGFTMDQSLSQAIPPADRAVKEAQLSWYYEWNEADATISANFKVDRGETGWESRGIISRWPKVQ